MLKEALLSLAVIGFLSGQSFAGPATPPPGTHKCIICGKIVWMKGKCPPPATIKCPRPPSPPHSKPTPIPHPNPHPGPKPHPGGPQPQ